MIEESLSIELPSRYLPYSTKSIQVKPLTNADIKLLISAEQDGVNTSILDVFRRRVEGIALEDLTVGDFWYILYWIRYNTFIDQPMPVPWVCPEDNCSTKNTSSLTNGNLATIQLSETFVEPIELTLPSGLCVSMRLPRFGDDMKADAFLVEQRKKRDKNRNIDRERYTIDAGDKMFVLTALTLEPTKLKDATTGEEKTMDLEERVRFVENTLTPNDVYLIGAAMKRYNHGVQNVANFTCQGCQKEQKVRFRLSMQAFFLEDDE